MTECCVCQELFKDTEEVVNGEKVAISVVKMPCSHIFHEYCLIPWLEKHNSCPTCRFELETEDKEYE